MQRTVHASCEGSPALARRIEVSFQQVQKYERGSNRISASKLYRIAEVLCTPVGYFFEGLSESGAPEPVREGPPRAPIWTRRWSSRAGRN